MTWLLGWLTVQSHVELPEPGQCIAHLIYRLLLIVESFISDYRYNQKTL